MSTDLELLELAAKAAGIDAARHDHDTANYEATYEGMYLKGYRTPDNCQYWNPLYKDGDSLRLAVKLNLEVVQFTTTVRVGGLEMGSDDCHEEKGSDPCAATRRAIVRAAAEIGRAME
jgi:hypothetical protein